MTEVEIKCPLYSVNKHGEMVVISGVYSECHCIF